MQDTDDWPFDQTPETATLTTRQVLELKEPIRQVVHYVDDHSWAFTCGTTDDENDYKVVHLDHLVQLDSSIRSIAKLEPGWTAWRDGVGQSWELSREALDE